jgi:hypothetical protein
MNLFRRRKRKASAPTPEQAALQRVRDRMFEELKDAERRVDAIIQRCAAVISGGKS